MHHHFIDRLALLNSLVAGIALFPQVWITYTSGSTAGISWLTFSLIFFNNIVWLVYGMHRSLISIVIAALLNALASLILLLSPFFLG